MDEPVAPGDGAPAVPERPATPRPAPAPPAASRPNRRTVAGALARALANFLAVLVGYYLLPLRGNFGWRTVLALAGGLVVVAILVTWQVRAVLRSRIPGLRAAQALALAVPIFLVLFAATYVVLADGEPQSFSEPLSRTDALYFVVTVFATVGFGDITPVSAVARVLVTVQMIGNLILIGAVVRSITGAARRAALARNPALGGTLDDEQTTRPPPGEP